MQIIDTYVKALQEHDWTALADTLSDEGLRRVGPFLDVVEGKAAYVAFLSGLMPTLQNYRLTVDRVSELSGAEVVVELRERLDVGGVTQEFPEAIFFGFDSRGLITTVRIYIQQPGASAPVEGGSAAS